MRLSKRNQTDQISIELTPARMVGLFYKEKSVRRLSATCPAGEEKGHHHEDGSHFQTLTQKTKITHYSLQGKAVIGCPNCSNGISDASESQGGTSATRPESY